MAIKLLRHFFPITWKEAPRFFLLIAIFFTVTFNTKILKILKDALIITAPDSGAETIPFLKTWMLIPFSLILINLYDRLSEWLSREKLFYYFTGGFLAFFLFFTVVLFPLREQLHFHGICDYLEYLLPLGFKGFISIFRHWTFSLFYVMAEMWPTILLSFIFWNFIACNVTEGEAKRFYGLFSLDFGGLAAGAITAILSSVDWGFLAVDKWHGYMSGLVGVITLAGLAQMGLYYLYHRNYGKAAPIQKRAPKVSEPGKKMTLKEKFKSISECPTLFYIAVCVFCFEFTDQLVEVVWKDQVSELYTTPWEFSEYMAKITWMTGVLGILVVFGVSSFVLREKPWIVGGLITPLILVSTSLLFFAVMLIPSFANFLGRISGHDPMIVIVTVGSVRSILMQVAKYTFFDNTKELAFLRFPEQMRLRGKGLSDAFASRLGKSVSSLSHQSLLLGLHSLTTAAPVIAIMVLSSAAAWLHSVFSLGKAISTPLEEDSEFSASG